MSGRSNSTCSTRRNQRRARPGHLGIGFGGHETTAGAGGQVDNQAAITRPDAVHHVAVQIDRHRRLAGFGIAHVNMRDRSTRLGRLKRAFGDLLRGDRKVWRLIRARQVACDCAGDDDLWVGLMCHL
jgi:hypothetical protein